MISGMLNICLQLIEALVVFYFYEGIRKNKNENKLRLLLIISSYVIMCVSNLIFNYNTFLNFLILLIFQYVIAKILYEFSAKSSAFYSSLITLLVFVTELVSITFTSVVFNTNSKEYTKDPYQYLLIILISKSLLFIVLKIISDIIKNSRDNTKVDYAFYIYPFSLIFVLFDFAIVFYSTELDGNLKIFISLTSLLFTVSIIVFCIFQQHTAEKEQELMELRTIREKEKIEEEYKNINEISQTINYTYKEYTNINSLDVSNAKIQNIKNKIELKEPETSAEIKINKTSLSTLEENNVEMSVVLKSANEKNTLYKNPKILIILPQGIESIKVNSINKLYADEFEVSKAELKNIDGLGKVIAIELKGEQTKYINEISQGIQIIINASITFAKNTAANKTDLTLRYTNDNGNEKYYEKNNI